MKLLSGYDMLVQNQATEIQELVTVSVETIIYLVGEVLHYQGFEAVLVIPERDPFQVAENLL